MGLDSRGGVAVAELIAYLPILFISVILVFRHGVKRQAGWIFILILANIRIVGSAIHIASENSSSANSTLIIIFSILENAGLSPLMLATLGFLNTVGQGVFEQTPLVSRGFRLLQIWASVALIMSIVGGVTLGNANNQDDLNSGSTFRHVGVILFLLLFVVVALLHLMYWVKKDQIMKHRRTLLLGVSAVLPFLFIRTLYAVLSGFSPVSVPPNPPPHNSLSKFSSTSGSWEIYLVMSVIAELLTVITYLVVGMSVPLKKDFVQTDARSRGEYGYRNDHELQLGPHRP